MSDQDFFFDEDEPKPSPKQTSKGAAPAKGSPASKSGAKAPAAPVATSVMDRSITVAVAAMVAVIGLLVGVILGFFLGQSSVVPSISTVSTPAATSGGGASPAPLTPEQLNQGLPTGHVPIGGTATSTPATTP